MRGAYALRCQRLIPCLLLTVTAAAPVAAEPGFGEPAFENWGFYQRNLDGTSKWTYWPRLYVPYRFGNGVTFTQRIDVPMSYTNASGPGTPTGGYSGGLGDAFIEEIFETPEIAKNLRLHASVRFVFPTGKQAPFGSSQYQWAPSAGLLYRLPDTGVTLAPFARYFSGFSPQVSGVAEVRQLTLFPAMTFELRDGWSLLLYPENPIIYDQQQGNWFVPLDMQLARKLDDRFGFAVGGA